MTQSPKNSNSGLTDILPVNILKETGNDACGISSGLGTYHASNDATFFSSSLPILPHEKSNVNVVGSLFGDEIVSSLSELDQGLEGIDSLEGIERNAVGSLLPDDEDELLAGIMDDFDFSGLPSSLEDLDEYDLFGSGGGLELESNPQDKLSMDMPKVNLSDAIYGNGVPHYGISNSAGMFAGEHPYGEHPSRTLFVRNINSNIEDSELQALFEQFGDIRTLYTACKHRGFVMISYYDIRAARTAMRALQNKPLHWRKLDIHFSIPKDNPSDKDINQGTLVVFNLDPSVSNEDLRQIFGAYGEVKEIRETPYKRHHKFIEFYDVRAAEAALKSLNKREIAGKRIKLEPSRPGGARRNLMLQLNQELEQDESRIFCHQVSSSVTNSPPGNWVQFNSFIEHSPLENISRSPALRTVSPTNSNKLPGLASLSNSEGLNHAKVAPICNDQRRLGPVEHHFPNSNLGHGVAFQQSHSFPEMKLGQQNRAVSTFSPSNSNGSSIETLSGPEFLWGSPRTYLKHTSSSAWPMSSVAHSFSSNGNGHAFGYSDKRSSFLGSSEHHHVGSAPSCVPTERHSGFVLECPETSLLHPVAFGAKEIGQDDGNFMVNMAVHGAKSSGVNLPRNFSGNFSSGFRMSTPRFGHVLSGNGPHPGVVTKNMEGLTERGRNRRVENIGNQVDSNKRFQLDLDKILSGEDTRTTLMIKNIPNKYTSKMLLATIDENHRGTYDFLYLPIDFKNKCNVGYAFINMVSPSHVITFYEAFDGKKWEKFNSEKVASLAYARIQGKTALVAHFQNSSLMNEDKRCRPILFHSEDAEAGCQEHLNSSLHVKIHQLNLSQSGDSLGILTKDGSVENQEKS
ncbi:protein MEI2-like 5 isoform X2 [Carica papaya]|uniref:protein MEI2-like 5 isoform X2 n=1 Tax=Carica papaya TaxID=3649 RepID=UPI000B8CDA85|nr:protein MEI2-like 5 isoform X2 [Carica papaya]XP_021904839.1 protein MEI2-like 5 isoform X2 [Carica papaya]XP_021904841.1 protein MEI2-like 5 isoform X2 [Carica papaya]